MVIVGYSSEDLFEWRKRGKNYRIMLFIQMKLNKSDYMLIVRLSLPGVLIRLIKTCIHDQGTEGYLSNVKLSTKAFPNKLFNRNNILKFD